MRNWLAWVFAMVLLLGAARWANGQTERGNIFSRLGRSPDSKGWVTVYQPWKLRRAAMQYQEKNERNPGTEGYRIRIYRGIGKKARSESEEVVNAVLKKWPGLPVYRNYNSPYFLVAAGDCRNRYEALAIREMLLKEYPQAFVIASHVNFPISDTLDLRERIEQTRQQNYLDSINASQSE